MIKATQFRQKCCLFWPLRGKLLRRQAERRGNRWPKKPGLDLLPNLPSFIRRVCSGFELRPFFGSPEAGVFRLIHDGRLAAPSRLSNVIGGFCPIAPWGRSSL